MANQDGKDDTMKEVNELPETGLLISRTTHIMNEVRKGKGLSPALEGEARKINALYQEGHKAGYNVGHTQGYQAGFRAGYREGHSKGYTEGCAKALERLGKEVEGNEDNSKL